MAEKSTFIKLDRNIVKWRWYKNPNTLRVFLHLLLTANIKDCGFENIVIHRGEAVTSYSSLAHALNISENAVRTAISHLKSTGEITVKSYSKFSVISIVSFDKYQSASTGRNTVKSQSSHSQATGNPQQSKNIKNIKERKEGADAPVPLSGIPLQFETEEEYWAWRNQ